MSNFFDDDKTGNDTPSVETVPISLDDITDGEFGEDPDIETSTNE